jgi:hypothetical protein
MNDVQRFTRMFSSEYKYVQAQCLQTCGFLIDTRVCGDDVIILHDIATDLARCLFAIYLPKVNIVCVNIWLEHNVDIHDALQPLTESPFSVERIICMGDFNDDILPGTSYEMFGSVVESCVPQAAEKTCCYDGGPQDPTSWTHPSDVIMATKNTLRCILTSVVTRPFVSDHRPVLCYFDITNSNIIKK